MTWVAVGVGGATLVGGMYGANQSANAQQDSLRQAGKQNKKAMALQQPWLDRSNQAADQLQMLMGLGNNATEQDLYNQLLGKYIKYNKIDEGGGIGSALRGAAKGGVDPFAQTYFGIKGGGNKLANQADLAGVRQNPFGFADGNYGGVLHGKESAQLMQDNPALAAALAGIQKKSGYTAKLSEQDYAALQADVAGQLAKNKASRENPLFGSLNKPFGMDQFTKDAGYDFRLGEGNKALDRSASARGNLFSGAQAKALTDYNQDFASNEYGNAYNRYTTDQGNLYNRLSGIISGGKQALQNSTGLYGNAADYAIGAGNVNAANTQAQIGALTSGIGAGYGAYSNPWGTQSGIQSQKAPNGSYQTPYRNKTYGSPF